MRGGIEVLVDIVGCPGGWRRRRVLVPTELSQARDAIAEAGTAWKDAIA